ncbi:MAG: hypothetical protein A3J75_00640 [Acidobacteria bacterium RBG_16_68_9]|nr:MAG: hypothetical protein A3J75_00640 [Acidobacteria bacterium RBG_16_68_9]
MLEVVIGLGSAALLTDEPFGAREAAGAGLILAACGAEFFAGASGSIKRRGAAPDAPTIP